jgi:hypothetical protein
LPREDEWRRLARHYGGISDDSNDDGKAAYQALVIGGSSAFNALLSGRRVSDQELMCSRIGPLLGCVFRSREEFIRKSIGLPLEPDLNSIEAFVEVPPQRSGVPHRGDEYSADERE